MKPCFRGLCIAIAAGLLATTPACTPVYEPEPTDGDVTVVTLNLVHGFFCADDHCRLEDHVGVQVDLNCPP